MSSSVRRSRFAIWAAIVAGVLLALAVRLMPWSLTWTTEGPLLADGDAYYHLRRVLDGVQHFPQILQFDRYMNFPEGAPPIWPPMLDRGVAALALLSGGSSSEATTTWVAVLVPAVIGALAVLPVALIAARLGGAAAAWIAALGVALLPGHVGYSRVGFLDHHVVYSLLGLVLLALLMREPTVRWRGWVPLAAGIALGLAISIWPGSILFAALIGLGGLASLLQRKEGDARPALSLADVALTLGVAALAIWPDASTSYWARKGEWSLTMLSHLQPVLLLAASALFAAGAGGAWLTERRGWSVLHRNLVLLTGLVIAGLASLAAAPVRDALDAARRWLTKDEAFQSRVMESLPLIFDHQGHLTLEFAWTFLGPWAILAPIALGYFVIRAWRGADGVRTYAIWLVAGSLLLWVQRRFVDLVGPLWVIAGSVLLVVLVGGLARRLHGSTRLRHGALAVVALSMLLPSLGSALESLEAAGEPDVLPPALAERRQLLSLARTLRERSPETRGFYERGVQPEYGVLGPWDAGHLLTTIGRRPVVANNFGDDIGEASFQDTIDFFSTEDPAVALAIAEKRHVRYVVSHLFYVRKLTPEKERRFQYALHYLDGRIPGGASLSQWRLLAETRFPEGEQHAAYKLWEHVNGALLQGRTLPGQPVVVVVRVRTNLGRTFSYGLSSVSDETGAFELRVPYARGASAWETAAESIEVRAPHLGMSAKVDVPESAVLQGEVIPVPELQ